MRKLLFLGLAAATAATLVTATAFATESATTSAKMAAVVKISTRKLPKLGTVLVTGTVKDLVAGSGIRFEDRGEHELKGVGERRIYAVSSV